MTPLEQTVERREFSVRINVVDAEYIGNVCARLGATPMPQSIRACARFHEKSNVLEMWVMPPRYLEDGERFSYIGHELWHGALGDFHSDKPIAMRPAPTIAAAEVPARSDF